MKKLSYSIFMASILAGCMKKVDEIKVGNDFSTVAFINASPGSTASPTSGNVYVDGIIQTAGAVAYRGTSGYLSVTPGNRSIRYTATSTDSARFIETSANFEARKAYTYVVYDTVPSTQVGNARRLKTLLLMDDLTLSGKQSNTAFVRVLHLAPSAAAVDVTFLRTNVTTPDSVTVTNRTYVGANPTQAQLDALGSFNTAVPLGFNGAYTIRVKAAGTQNVLTMGNAFLATQTINQSFVTVYVTGGAQGQPVGLGVFRHYP